MLHICDIYGENTDVLFTVCRAETERLELSWAAFMGSACLCFATQKENLSKEIRSHTEIEVEVLQMENQQDGV